MKNDIFQAIADPTRRMILVLIAAQAMTPNELAAHFASTRQAVSKHIQILADCKLVQQQKTGRTIYYHIDATQLQQIDRWLEQFRQLWHDRFKQLDELLINLNTDKHEN